MNSAIYRVFLTLALFSLCSCGKETPPAQAETQDTSVFKSAIGNYLREKNYGMEISSFDELSIKDNKASAICKMGEAENLYGIRVTWEFNFENSSGEWKVSGHQQK